MKSRSIPQPVSILPEPTEEEVAAIVAALLATQEAEPAQRATAAGVCRWTLTGRHAAHHASPHARQQWSRSMAWLQERERR